MTYPNKRLIAILAGATALLLVPLLAMQFTTEVNWSVFDFLVAGVLLFGAGLLIEMVLRKATRKNFKLGLIVLIVALLLLTWAELAVGVFGTPFAGN
jgi:dipeptide/tripeptide permease